MIRVRFPPGRWRITPASSRSSDNSQSDSDAHRPARNLRPPRHRGRRRAVAVRPRPEVVRRHPSRVRRHRGEGGRRTRRPTDRRRGGGTAGAARRRAGVAAVPPGGLRRVLLCGSGKREVGTRCSRTRRGCDSGRAVGLGWDYSPQSPTTHLTSCDSVSVGCERFRGIHGLVRRHCPNSFTALVLLIPTVFGNLQIVRCSTQSRGACTALRFRSRCGRWHHPRRLTSVQLAKTVP